MQRDHQEERKVERVTCRKGLFTRSVWLRQRGSCQLRLLSWLLSALSLSVLSSPGSLCQLPVHLPPTQLVPAWDPEPSPSPAPVPAPPHLSSFAHSTLMQIEASVSSQLSQSAQPCCDPHPGPAPGRISLGSGSHPALLGHSRCQLGPILLWILCSEPGQCCISTLAEPSRKHCFLPLSLPVLGTATTEA